MGAKPAHFKQPTPKPAKKVTVYSLAEGIDPNVLSLSPEMSVYGVSGSTHEGSINVIVPTDKSGDDVVVDSKKPQVVQEKSKSQRVRTRPRPAEKRG